jgi:hypothetical protein
VSVAAQIGRPGCSAISRLSAALETAIDGFYVKTRLADLSVAHREYDHATLEISSEPGGLHHRREAWSGGHAPRSVQKLISIFDLCHL